MTENQLFEEIKNTNQNIILIFINQDDILGCALLKNIIENNFYKIFKLKWIRKAISEMKLYELNIVNNINQFQQISQDIAKVILYSFPVCTYQISSNTQEEKLINCLQKNRKFNQDDEWDVDEILGLNKELNIEVDIQDKETKWQMNNCKELYINEDTQKELINCQFNQNKLNQFDEWDVYEILGLNKQLNKEKQTKQFTSNYEKIYFNEDTQKELINCQQQTQLNYDNEWDADKILGLNKESNLDLQDITFDIKQQLENEITQNMEIKPEQRKPKQLTHQCEKVIRNENSSNLFKSMKRTGRVYSQNRNIQKPRYLVLESQNNVSKDGKQKDKINCNRKTQRNERSSSSSSTNSSSSSRNSSSSSSFSSSSNTKNTIQYRSRSSSKRPQKTHNNYKRNNSNTRTVQNKQNNNQYQSKHESKQQNSNKFHQCKKQNEKKWIKGRK